MIDISLIRKSVLEKVEFYVYGEKNYSVLSQIIGLECLWEKATCTLLFL